MRSRAIATYPGWRRQIGFTLAELLVASVLGLFIIAGAASVFTANRETARIGERVQTNQEARRYVAQTISRVVRAGESFNGTSESKLVVNFSDDLPDDVRDCLGDTAAGSSNSFATALNTDTGKYELLCQRDNEEPQALIDGLARPSDRQSNIVVQLLKPCSKKSDCPEKMDLGDLIDATDNEATSVKISIRMLMPDGSAETDDDVEAKAFIATMRCAVLHCSTEDKL